MTTGTAQAKKYSEMTEAELKERGAELRSAYQELHEGERNDEYSSRVAAILEEVKLLDTNLTLVRTIDWQRQLDQGTAPSAATGASGSRSEAEKTFADLVMGDESFAAWMKNAPIGGANDRSPGVEVPMGLYGMLRSAEVFEHQIRSGVRANVFEWGAGGPGNASTGSINTLLPVGQPIPPRPRRARLYMRDLIPVHPTTLPAVPYVRELNPTTNETGASSVAEGNTKPDQTVQFQGDTAGITVIAGNITISKQIFADAPLVVGYLNGRLPYLVLFREDNEVLNGNGLWPDIKGILQFSGLQSQVAVSGQTAQTIGNAIAKVENVDGTATAVVMNPTDAWAMFILRAASGAGTFDAGIPFSIAGVENLTVWGLPVKRTRAKAAGTALVGDYQMGATIWDRESVNVQVYPQNEDYAKKNLVLMQAEERVGLSVERPDLFVNATIA